MCHLKEGGSCSSQESQNMYPLKKRKLFYQNHPSESHDAPCTGMYIYLRSNLYERLLFIYIAFSCRIFS